jgi:hypothetical protein
MRSETTPGSLVGTLRGGTDLFYVAARSIGLRISSLTEGLGQVLDVGLQHPLEEVRDARRRAVALGRQGVGQLVERGVAAGGEGDDSGDRVLG